jgi:hypothetical protein
VKPVCKPSVDINGHGVIGYCPDSSLFDRHRVLLQGREESFRETRMLSEQHALSRIWAFEKDGGFHDVLIRHTDPIAVPDLEGESAAADALGLVLNLLEAPATYRDAHFDEPVIEIAAKLDVTRLGSERL